MTRSIRWLICVIASLTSLPICSAQGKLSVDLARNLEAADDENLIPILVTVSRSTTARNMIDELRTKKEAISKEGRLGMVREFREVGASVANSLGNQLADKHKGKLQVLPGGTSWLGSCSRMLASPEVIRELTQDERVLLVTADLPRKLNLPDVSPVPAADQPPQWSVAGIGAPQAWSQGHVGEGVLVAVIDTGVDVSHAGFEGRIYSNVSETPNNNVDEDANEMIDDQAGWDFVNKDNNPYDDEGHGTHCAGTVLGGRGIGVAPKATLLPLKVLDEAGAGREAHTIAAIEYAIEQGADVISLSLGWHAPTTNRAAWQNVMEEAELLGVIVVAAAGNEGDKTLGTDPNGQPIPWPIRSPGEQRSVLTLGAIDQLGNLADFSSRGPISYTIPGEPMLTYAKPDLVAYGVSIISFQPGNAQGKSSGTSMATPAVAGAAAILRGAFPAKDAVAIKQALRLSATAPQGPNRFGDGLINIPAALTWLENN